MEELLICGLVVTGICAILFGVVGVNIGITDNSSGQLFMGIIVMALGVFPFWSINYVNDVHNMTVEERDVLELDRLTKKYGPAEVEEK